LTSVTRSTLASPMLFAIHSREPERDLARLGAQSLGEANGALNPRGERFERRRSQSLDRAGQEIWRWMMKALG
jgi:hypothetical protein